MKDIEDVFPVTIIDDRYGGCYSGAKFLAFNLEPWDIPQGVSWGGDVDCAEFWSDEAPYYIIGKGNTPDEAYTNLCSQQDKLKIVDVLSCDEYGNNPLPFCDVLKVIKKLGGYENAMNIFKDSERLSKLTFDEARRIYGNPLSNDIKERLLYELFVIRRTGHSKLFLHVHEILNYARKELCVMAEVIRDAVAGSLVAYCLGITKIDPLKYDLLFERFMRLEKYNPPIFNIDCDEGGFIMLKNSVEEKCWNSDKLKNIVIHSNKSLTVIKRVCKLIQESLHVYIDVDTVPINDPDTIKLFQEGNTDGVPMFESEQMKNYLQELKPKSFEDISILYALNNLGNVGKIKLYIACKYELNPIRYMISCMDKYLSDTSGILVYQEQIVLLSRLLADFNREESFSLVDALRYKKQVVLKALRGKFVEQGRKNGHAPIVLDRIWNQWEEIGDKISIKAQVFSYTLFAYRAAYLKAHFPYEFMAAIKE